MFGFGAGGPFGGSLLSSMFNDPFFTDPFAHMDRMMNMHAQVPRPTFQPSQQGASVHRSMSQPIIEEVHDDEDEDAHRRTGAHEAVVEEPDDDADPTQRPAKRHESTAPPSSQHHNPPQGNLRHSSSTRQISVQGSRPPSLLDAFFGGSLSGSMLQNPGSSGTSYSFSSTTFTSSGPNGVTYQTSHAERQGPGGVREVQRSVRDGRTGQHSMTITRGVGDKERTMTRIRDATGREYGDEALRGIAQDEVHRFDNEWREHAERSLLGVGGGPVGSHTQARSAVPLQLTGGPTTTAHPAAPSYAPMHHAYTPSASNLRRAPSGAAPAHHTPVYATPVQGHVYGATTAGHRPAVGTAAGHTVYAQPGMGHTQPAVRQPHIAGVGQDRNFHHGYTQANVPAPAGSGQGYGSVGYGSGMGYGSGGVAGRYA